MSDGRTTRDIRVASNPGEFVIDIDGSMIIMVPIRAKELASKLREKIAEYESSFGTIHLPGQTRGFTQNLMEHLYHRRKVSRNLFTVDTRKKTTD